MSKIREAFANGKAFIAFLTAGDPTAECTVNYILEMEKAGADLIEIGIPFSDPTAEGVVIQEASLRALKGGMTTEGVFQIVEEVRKKSQVPLALMTYLNPVFHYGYEAFFSRCQSLGVDGIIVPDLPFEEKGEAEEVAARFGVDVVSLIAPTSKERIRLIAKEAKGFIYVVSSMGVTGVRSKITTDIAGMVKEIRAVTDTHCAIGFGISTPEQAAEMAGYADGVIVGSAIVKLIEKKGANAEEELYRYVSSMKAAIK
ncbi:MAG: tryptophan synthase subunit alpha [Lachnospiraceae bacterium]|nr:tryptophan synthase subunit alpha [Lachnospiraceae bacterium]